MTKLQRHASSPFLTACRRITATPVRARPARVAGLASTLGIVVLAVGCGSGPGTPRQPAPAVTTVRAAARRVEVGLPFTGLVQPAHAVRLVALVEGRVTRVAVADGGEVAAGRLLLTLGGPQVEARRQALAAAADSARQQVAATATRLAQAQRRAQSHLAGPGELTRAERDAAASRASLADAHGALAQLDSALQVTAPVSGRFTNRQVSPGQDVAPGDPLAEILEPGSLRVTAEVMPRSSLELGKGQAAEIDRASAGPLLATVAAVQPTVGPGGTVRVWLTGKALDSLAPGTAVRGRIVAAVHEHAVTVPASAVVRDKDDRPLVFVGHATPFEERAVTTGETGPGWIEITSGLAAGDEVVTAGAYELYWAGFAQTYKVED